MKTLLKIIYLLSTLPLAVGSVTFFYWFYKRTWFAENAEIEVVALFTIIGFLFFALIAIILCIVFAFKNRSEVKKIILPIVIIAVTVPIIDLYSSSYTSLSEKAYIRIINDTDQQISRIWSANFEMTDFENKGNNFVISYYPVYTYDWSEEYSVGYHYDINAINIDLILKGDSIETTQLHGYSKGDCATIKLSKIIHGN